MMSAYKLLFWLLHFTKITYYIVQRGFILGQWLSIAYVQAAPGDLVEVVGPVQYKL